MHLWESSGLSFTYSHHRRATCNFLLPTCHQSLHDGLTLVASCWPEDHYHYQVPGKEVCAVFFNIWKAFDSIPHKALVDKLPDISLNSHLISWYKSGRLFKVKILFNACMYLVPCSLVGSGYTRLVCISKSMPQVSLKRHSLATCKRTPGNHTPGRATGR